MGQVELLSVQEPTLVIPRDREDFRLTKAGATSFHITWAIDDIPNREHGVHPLGGKVLQGVVEGLKLPVKITEDSKPAESKRCVHRHTLAVRFPLWPIQRDGRVERSLSLVYTSRMFDLRFVADDIDTLQAGLARRGFGDDELFERIGDLASRRRAAITAVESARAKQNEASAKMAKLDKKSEEFTQNREALRSLSAEIKELGQTRQEVEAALQELLLGLPNLPSETTPDGKSEADNREVRVWGEKPSFDFEARDHVEVGTGLGIIDFERAAKLSGARFVVLRGAGSRLNRALLQFMLDIHTGEHGYEEVWSPILVKDSCMLGTGQLPKFAQDSFRIAKDEEWASENEASQYDLYLVPTAEVPLTNLHREEILTGSDLPIAYTGYTACFRSEAGSYGKDTRGMIRQHQFDKVELVRFVRPEDTTAQLEALTSHAETILQRLGLHYRVVELCAGDLGFGAEKTFDLEVWLPGQQAYREISSCSSFGSWQARRMGCRYRPEPKAKPEYVHTLNGSGLAIGRTLLAILEQNQHEDGSVTVPEALRPYLGGLERISAAAT